MQPSGRRGEGGRLKIENFQSQVCACVASINLTIRKALAKMIQFNKEKMKSRAEMGAKVNKKCRQLWTLLLLCTMCMTGIAGAGIQASAKEYSYEIVFYAGNRGRFTGTAGVSVISSGGAAEVFLEGGGNAIRVRGLGRGDQVIFEADRNVELTEGGRYYVKGIRLSGRDNNTVSSPAITLTGQNQRDMDYVVAYGIRGEMTSYYVRYEDAAGRELAPERAYYGNVGDKPVVAFLYVEGYVPQAYNLTKTLSKNEAENIFTFVYNPAATGNGGGGGTGGGQGGNPDASGAGAGVGTEGPDAPGGEGVGAGPTGNDAPEGTAEAGTAETGIQEGAEGAGGADTPLGAANGEAGPGEDGQEGPLELLDLEDEEVPLAMQELGQEGEERGGAAEGTGNAEKFFYAEIAMACIAVSALILFGIWWWKRRKKDDPKEENS